jgi:hypothetical protein
MNDGSIQPEEILSHLSTEDLLRLRELLSSGIHDLSPSQVETLKSLISIYSEYKTELKTLVEEKQVSIMWTKVRLQAVVVVKYILYGVLAIFAAVQTVDGAAGVIKKWWTQ